MSEEIKNTKLEQLDQRIKQLENQKKAILKREKEKERKARTRRLIQMGAIAEQYFSEFETPEQFESYLKYNEKLIKSFKKEVIEIKKNNEESK